MTRLYTEGEGGEGKVGVLRAENAQQEEVMKEALLALADRCETSEPSRLLDADIALAIFPDARPSGDDAVAHIRIGLTSKIVERYTTSLDAAVTLVPVKAWGVSHNGDDALAWMYVAGGRLNTCAATMPLALCAAALRARASLAKPHGGESR